MLKIKKGNYLAIIQYDSYKKMIEVESKNEEEAFQRAFAYASACCEAHNLEYKALMVIKIPDCITVVE